MTPEQFCYWLRGYLEIAKPEEMEIDEIKEIESHLNLVMEKVTPTQTPISKTEKSINDWIRDIEKKVPDRSPTIPPTPLIPPPTSEDRKIC